MTPAEVEAVQALQRVRAALAGLSDTARSAENSGFAHGLSVAVAEVARVLPGASLVAEPTFVAPRPVQPRESASPVEFTTAMRAGMVRLVAQDPGYGSTAPAEAA